MAFGFLLSMMDLVQTLETHRWTVTSVAAGDDAHRPARTHRMHMEKASMYIFGELLMVYRGFVSTSLGDTYHICRHVEFQLLYPAEWYPLQSCYKIQNENVLLWCWNEKIVLYTLSVGVVGWFGQARYSLVKEDDCLTLKGIKFHAGGLACMIDGGHHYRRLNPHGTGLPTLCFHLSKDGSSLRLSYETVSHTPNEWI